MPLMDRFSDISKSKVSARSRCAWEEYRAGPALHEDACDVWSPGTSDQLSLDG